jgi:pimeloyl-ACP methyl ester carboxylesterase
MPCRRSITLLLAFWLLLAAWATPPQAVADTPLLRPGKAPKPAPSYTPRFVAVACPFDPAGERVDCGYLVVPENRARPAGRQVKLALAIIRSRAAQPQPDPVLYLEGGPGGGAVYDPTFWYESPLLEQRDIILLDQRGTGYSLPSLNCPELEAAGVATFADEVRAAGACHKRLAGEGVDLTQYNSAAIAADIADLRVALAAPQINLFGVSYGTRAALTVMRDHPTGIRSVILDSTYPPEVDAYTEGAANAAAAIEVLFEGCAADPECDAAYPQLEVDFYRLVARLNRRPALLERTDPYSGETYEERLEGDALVSYLVDWLYDTWALPLLPRALGEAAAGRYEPLVALLDGTTDEAPEPKRAVRFRVQDTEGVMDTTAAERGDVTDSEGLFYSVECREELPFGDLAAARRALRPFASVLHTPLMASLEQTAAICAVWDAGRAHAIEDRPVASDIPTLVLAGEYDPVTPPHWGEAAAGRLTNSFFFEFPGTGHGVIFSDTCPERMAAAFLENPGKPPSASCLAHLGPSQFVLP